MLFIFGCLVSNAEILLEKQFQGSKMNVVNLSATYFYSINTDKNQVSVYKENFMPLKTVSLNSLSNYKISNVMVTDKVFNNSTDLEFLVSVNKVTGAATDADECKLLLYNENGQVIYDFGAGTILNYYITKTVSGTSKMILQRMIYNFSIYDYSINTEIYSLPGNYTGMSAVKSSDEVQVNYDAQSKTIEFLPTQVTDNFTLKLYNTDGKELMQRQYNELINGKISISTENLNSGVYIFCLNEVSGKILIK